MDVLRLSEPSYKPDAMVEGYSSFIWTERFQEPGEFELRTPHIVRTRALLPDRTLITHRKTNEVMFVEDHKIDNTGSDGPELVITGKSLTDYTKYRTIVGTESADRVLMNGYTTPRMALTILLWNAFCNTSNRDISRHRTWNNTLLHFSKRKVQNLAISDSGPGHGDSVWREIAEGPLKNTIDLLLAEGNLGLRMIRPDSAGHTISIGTGASNHSEITKHNSPNITAMRMDIYGGRNRTVGHSLEPVIFMQSDGHLKDSSYLFSNKELRGILHWGIDYPPGYTEQIATPAGSGTGFDCRVEYRNYGRQSDEDVVQTALSRNAEGRALLKNKLIRTELVEGEVSPGVKYKYGPNGHYYLGDLVTYKDDYGNEATMQVTEHIRTSDWGGERDYPGLSLFKEEE